MTLLLLLIVPAKIFFDIFQVRTGTGTGIG